MTATDPSFAAEGPGPTDLQATTEALLFSVEQCAAMLGVHRTTVYDLIQSEQLASLKVGRRRLVSRSAMERFIAKNEREETDDC